MGVFDARLGYENFSRAVVGANQFCNVIQDLSLLMMWIKKVDRKVRLCSAHRTAKKVLMMVSLVVLP